MVLGDTIAAIATASGRGGVAVVRLSGPEAFRIAEALTGKAPRAGRMSFSKISAAGVLIDEGVVLGFSAPHSYTGEDVVELQCHGGSVTPRRVLEATLAAGARLARRGEFTQRAFLNGKLDYDQAESVLKLVDAKTERAADAALQGLGGRRKRACRDLYESALDLSATIEHALDISEEELPENFLREVAARIDGLQRDVEREIRRAKEGRLLHEGVKVVLAGAPNAGKSSLMNALLDENRVLVSATPGTTRDSVEAWLDLDGWPICLTDTAGIRVAENAVEREGVKRAEELAARADLVLLLDDSPLPLAPSAVLKVHSKCDLGRGEGLNVSAKTGEGLEELKRAIVARLENQATDEGEPPPAQAEELVEVRALLASARGLDLVLTANVLRTAAEKLGALAGAVYSSDMLDRLFSRFCVGK